MLELLPTELGDVISFYLLFFVISSFRAFVINQFFTIKKYDQIFRECCIMRKSMRWVRAICARIPALEK